MAKKKLIEQHGLSGLYGIIDPDMAKKMAAIVEGTMTGQMMAMKQQDKDGREVFALFGVVAVSKGVLKDMHKYPLAGIPRQQHIDIIFSTAEGEDRSEFNGVGIAGILESPEWRV